jgi:hypothetical protein
LYGYSGFFTIREVSFDVLTHFFFFFFFFFVFFFFLARLHIYDISGGRAAALSEALLGQRIEGVWHTGIVVFGREYYYGGGHGIESTAVGRTPYGVPGQTLQLGHTRATLDAFSAFLREIDARFLARHYHLFEHNCNSFTDECARFLTGKGIPDWIARQHELLLGTELGRRVGPLLMGMYNAMFNVQVRTGASVHTRPRREREVEGPVDARGLPVGWGRCKFFFFFFFFLALFFSFFFLILSLFHQPQDRSKNRRQGRAGGETIPAALGGAADHRTARRRRLTPAQATTHRQIFEK